mgnify:CR=1 FL=1
MVTVFRLVNGQPQPFPGPKCRWMETYSNRGKDDASPNAMWMKRPYAQLEKCAEAAALRRAFPEEGSYTAEEMHGKDLDETEPLNVTPQEQQQPAPVQRAEPKPRKGAAAAKEAAKEVIVEQEPAKTEPAPAPTAQEPKNVTPEPVKEASKPVEQPKAAPSPDKPAPRAFLKDGENIVAVCEVVSLEAVIAVINGVKTPSVKGVVKGDYNGPVKHLGGGKMEGELAVPAAPWKQGATLSLKLSGRMSTAKNGPDAGKVIAWVEGAEEVAQEF